MNDNASVPGGLDRRTFMGYFAGIGLSSTLLPGVLWGKIAEGAEITSETIACAEEIAGIELSAEQREVILEDIRQQREQIEALHRVPIPNDVPPALLFNPVLPGMRPGAEERGRMTRSRVALRERPGNLEELAFLPVAELSEMVRRRRVSSMELTRMYLDRIRRHDPALHAVVTVTEERALRQAQAADEEIRRGRYRGPLHGIPWGAKDLLVVEGYPTTWGVELYREQMLEGDATVVERLDRAGAVLVAKLTLGELAWGDVWFGGMTRNPWKVEQGASGSSAGPGAATAAGMVGFSIGSETLGSISSPATRSGVTGLRPTFGRVPRTGAIALSWTMDKLGPMCRSAEDCALVFGSIYGPDGQDLTVHQAPFIWDARVSPRQLRIGFFQKAVERDLTEYPSKPFDLATLDVLRSLGANLIPVELPELPYSTMSLILSAEAGAAFDEYTRAGHVDRMVRQGRNTWPTVFRAAHFIPAVDYINANRVRTMAMRAWAELFQNLDVIVTPTSAPNQLLATNLTGHPALILPNGFRDDGTPVSITFLGDLFGESKILALGHAYQSATDFHRRQPALPG
ncbi:MAG: amidase [Gemmatimonadetes bacterium]|nr:amidase [Gemmatimonadota bacterium]